MSFPDLSIYPERYASAIRWGNAKYPQLQFVQPILGGAVIMREAVMDGDAWNRFLEARASEAQLHKLGTAAAFAHQKRGIDVTYQPHARNGFGKKDRGRYAYYFGNRFLEELMDGAKGKIKEVTRRYAQPLRATVEGPIGLDQELFSGRHADEANALSALWQAGSAALHSEAALSIGQQLDAELTDLDPHTEAYREGHKRVAYAAADALGKLITAQVAEARQPVVSDERLDRFTSYILF